jgi:hypothetical protein
VTHNPVTLVAAVLVGTLAVARCTRLVTSDDWPPIAWVRARWEWWQTDRDVDAANDARGYPHATRARSIRHGWGSLLKCPFCFAPYAAAGDLALAWYSDLATWWWLVNLWAAVAYVAAMIVARDEPPAEDE